jgi:hypothetical protein
MFVADHACNDGERRLRTAPGSLFLAYRPGRSARLVTNSG